MAGGPRAAAAGLMQLQRRAGNGYVQRLVEQRSVVSAGRAKPNTVMRLPAGEAMRGDLAGTGAYPEETPLEGAAFWANLMLDVLADELDAYKEVERTGDLTDPGTLRERQRLLLGMQRRARGLFEASDPGNEEHARRLLGLMNEIQDEYATVIGYAVATGQVPYVGGGEPAEADAAQIWGSLADPRSRIRAQNRPAGRGADKIFPGFVPYVLAGIAQMLQAPTARALLRDLQQGPGTVTIAPHQESGNPEEADRTNRDPNIPQRERKRRAIVNLDDRARDAWVRFAFLTDRDGSIIPDADDTDDYWQAELLSDERLGQLHGDSSRFDPPARAVPSSGMGAVVKLIAPPRPSHAALQGEADIRSSNILMTPLFLILAHELGHARNIQMGRDRSHMVSAAIPADFGGDLEEMNVVALENLIRAELGMRLRDTYNVEDRILEWDKRVNPR